MKKQSKIMITVILLLLIIGGCWYYKYSSNKTQQVSNNTEKNKAAKINSNDKATNSSTTDNKNDTSNSKSDSTSDKNSKSVSKSDTKTNSSSALNKSNDKVTLPEITAVNLGLSYAIEINYDTVKGKAAAVKFYSGNKEIKSQTVNLEAGKFTVDDTPTSLEVLDKDGTVIAVAKIKS